MPCGGAAALSDILEVSLKQSEMNKLWRLYKGWVTGNLNMEGLWKWRQSWDGRVPLVLWLQKCSWGIKNTMCRKCYLDIYAYIRVL